MKDESKGSGREVTLSEAAKAVKMSAFQARSLILKGQLEGRLMGRFWVVTTLSIEAYQARQASAT